MFTTRTGHSRSAPLMFAVAAVHLYLDPWMSRYSPSRRLAFSSGTVYVLRYATREQAAGHATVPTVQLRAVTCGRAARIQSCLP